MNKKLAQAEKNMLALFKANPLKEFEMRDLLVILGHKGNREPEVRAAFWTLMAGQHLTFTKTYRAKLNN